MLPIDIYSKSSFYWHASSYDAQAAEDLFQAGTPARSFEVESRDRRAPIRAADSIVQVGSARANHERCDREQLADVTPPSSPPEFEVDDLAVSFVRSGAPETNVQAVVCLPTFRRPEMLRDTLQSLAGQTSEATFAVIVVDNDPVEMEGAAIARAFFEYSALAGFCVVEPRPGHCRACNRAFSEARARFPNAPYILMIDDDEAASPSWLERMLEAAHRTKVDIVGGPVFPRFQRPAARGLASHPVYWPAYTCSGLVPMIYGSGNFLIRQDAFQTLERPEFDMQYNFLGGGDLEFFTRCRRAGMTFYWEQAAQAFETVTSDRARVRWALRRGLRIGVINYSVDRSFSRSARGRLKLFAKNAVLIPVSAFRAFRLLAQGQPSVVCLHPIAIAVGRIFGSFGFLPEAYRLSRVE